MRTTPLHRSVATAGFMLLLGLVSACGDPTEIATDGPVSTATSAAPTSTPTSAATTTAPTTTGTTTTLPPTTVAPTTTADPNRIDASTVLRRGRFGPITAGMTVADLERLLGPVDIEAFDDFDPTGAYCGSFEVPGAPDVTVGVFTENGGRSRAAVAEIAVYDGPRASEFGIHVGDPAGAVMAARVENLVRKPHVYDAAGAYLESDTAAGGFRFQVSDMKVTAMQTGPAPADWFSVEGFCI